jgi:2-dehydro-3-deoxyphosphogluconate aldolase/(4S)-4-hydroxy-2-oxoglutarate aldolase
LALPNVKCCGGSWLAPTDAIKNKDWQVITDLAAEALK